MKQGTNAIQGAFSRTKSRAQNTTPDELLRQNSSLGWNSWDDWEDVGMGDGEEVLRAEEANGQTVPPTGAS